MSLPHIEPVPPCTTRADDHFQLLARLLDLESQAEVQQIRKAGQRRRGTGESLAGLIVVEETSGLGGRFIWTLAKRNRTVPLPWNRLKPGVPVLLSARRQEGRRLAWRRLRTQSPGAEGGLE